MRKRIWAAALALAMLLTLIPSTALAVDGEGQGALLEAETDVYVPDTTDMPDNDELFAGYVEKLLYADINQGSRPWRAPAGNKLTGTNKEVYDFLKGEITKVAEGTLAETTFSISATGVTKNDISLILSYLLADCPYELYWYDKTVGMGISVYQTSGYVAAVSFYVAAAYSATGVKNTTAMKSGTVISEIVEKVKATALAVVTANKDKSTYERLVAYKNYICDKVSYNHDALGAGVNYGDPWQLIYVFDEDPTTNVVCEGYAKAFQYLCDLTTDLGADCYTVSGTMGGGTGAGGHMWNIVRIDDKNSYLVDVTNCDAGSIGAPNKLFMVGGGEIEDPHGTYSYSLGTSPTTYKYYDNTSESGHTDQFTIWDPAILTLAKDNYAAPGAPASIEIICGDPDNTTSTGTPVFNIPAATLTAPKTREVTFTATAKDGNNNKLSSQTFTWALSHDYEGISLTPSGDKATLTISSGALQEYDNGWGSTIAVTATVSSTSGEKSVLINVPTRTAKYIQILKNNTVLSSDNITAGTSVTYTAKVYDQYGIEMDGRDVSYGDKTPIEWKPITIPTVKWTTDDSGVATVSNGVVTALEGAENKSTTITASIEGTSSSASLGVTVIAKGAHTVTVADQTLTYGDELTVKPTSSTGATSFTYTSDNTYVVTVDRTTGKLTATGVGAATITVTAEASDGYTEGTTTFDVTVNAKSVKNANITLTNEDAITYNGTAQAPAVEVVVDGRTLGATDYTAEYSNNTDAGTNTAIVTVTGIVNYADTATKNFTIKPAPLTITANPQSIVYGATLDHSVTSVTTDKLLGSDTLESITLTPSTENVTTTGTITASAAVITNNGKTVTGNYTITYQTGTLTITKAAQAAPAAPTATDENIKDTSITLTAIPNAEYSTDGTTWQDSQTFNGLTPNTEYTFYARLKVDENHEVSPNSAAAKITTKKTMLDNATVAVVGGPFTYTGAQLTPEVTVTLNETTLTKVTDYAVTYGENINAGKGTVTVTASATSSYSGSKTVEFDIGKADLTATGTGIAKGTYGAKLSELTVEGLTANLGSTTVPGTWALTGTTIPDVGDTTAYIATFTPTDNAGNYNELTANVTVEIAPADLTANPTASISIKYDDTNPKSVGASDFGITVAGTFTVTVNSTGITGGENLAASFPSGGTSIQVQLKAGLTAPETETTITIPVTFTPESKNYKPVDLTLTIKVTSKTVSPINVRPFTKTYDGSAVTMEDLKTYLTSGDVEGTWAATALPTNAGTHSCSVTFTPTDAENYTTETTNISITINRANATIKADDVSLNVGGTLPAPFTYTATPAGVTVSPAPTLACDAANTDTAGRYTITITGPSASADGNYNITYQNGTLTITAVVAPTTYTVTFNANGGTVTPATATTGTNGKLTSLPTPTRSGYRFDGWFTLADGGTQITTDTVFTANTTVYAHWTSTGGGGSSSGGGGGSSSGGSTTTPSQGVTTGTTNQGTGSQTTPTTQTTATPNATTRGDTATASVSASVGSEIVKQAKTNNSETVVIAPTVTGDVNKTEVSIPAATVGQIGTETSASLTVSTAVADVTIPNDGLSGLSQAGGTVTVTAEKTGNTVELSVTAGGKTVENVPVTLTVPMTDTTAGTVAVLVHEDGTREVIRKSAAIGDGVTIPLSGSAKVEIVDNSKSFTDVPATNWAADAVSFASSHELFNGTGNGQFSPNLPMSRGMLAVVLHNLESNPSQSFTGSFGDVSDTAWYAEGVSWAAERGIVTGYSGGQFGPNDDITREQLAVMLWRYAGSPTASNSELRFADAGQASSWSRDALCWATEQGILNGKGGGILDPGGKATRAQAAQMLMNFIAK